MATIVAVYTGQGLMELVRDLFRHKLPDARLVNILDDSIIHDVIKAGRVTPEVARRLFNHFSVAADMGADLILSTCSSVGDIVGRVRPLFNVPVVRIDEEMARIAVGRGGRIGVLATLPTTLDPTVRLLRSVAEETGAHVQIVEGLADGAYQALAAGRASEHDALLMETAMKTATRADTIVLAQGSMARIKAEIAERTGKATLASPELAVAALARTFAEG